MARVDSSVTPAALSRQDAAQYLGISTDTLDRLRAAGLIKAFAGGARLVRYRVVELDAYMKRACLEPLPSSRSATHPTGSSSGSRADIPDDVRRGLATARKLPTFSRASR